MRLLLSRLFFFLLIGSNFFWTVLLFVFDHWLGYVLFFASILFFYLGFVFINNHKTKGKFNWSIFYDKYEVDFAPFRTDNEVPVYITYFKSHFINSLKAVGVFFLFVGGFVLVLTPDSFGLIKYVVINSLVLIIFGPINFKTGFNYKHQIFMHSCRWFNYPIFKHFYDLSSTFNGLKCRRSYSTKGTMFANVQKMRYELHLMFTHTKKSLAIYISDSKKKVDQKALNLQKDIQ